MFVSPSVDQLRVHSHFAVRTLDATFQDVSNPKLLRDLAQVPWIAGFVDHHRRVTYHFQIGYLGEISQNLVLHPVGKISVLLFRAQIFKWQDRDALVGNRYSFVSIKEDPENCS